MGEALEILLSVILILLQYENRLFAFWPFLQKFPDEFGLLGLVCLF